MQVPSFALIKNRKIYIYGNMHTNKLWDINKYIWVQTHKSVIALGVEVI